MLFGVNLLDKLNIYLDGPITELRFLMIKKTSSYLVLRRDKGEMQSVKRSRRVLKFLNGRSPFQDGEICHLHASTEQVPRYSRSQRHMPGDFFACQRETRDCTRLSRRLFYAIRVVGGCLGVLGRLTCRSSYHLFYFILEFFFFLMYTFPDAGVYMNIL